MSTTQLGSDSSSEVIVLLSSQLTKREGLSAQESLSTLMGKRTLKWIADPQRTAKRIAQNL